MRVVCVGLATVDLIQVTGRLPGPDEKVEAESAELGAGGPALNAAVTAAALGASVTLVSAVGAHPVGELIKIDLARYGVSLLDATPAATAPPPISSVVVLAASGRRSVVSRNAGDAAVGVPPGLDRVLAGADAVLIDGHHPALASAAAAAGRPVVVDAGSWRPVFAEVLPRASLVACSAQFRPPRTAAAGAPGAPGDGNPATAVGPPGRADDRDVAADYRDVAADYRDVAADDRDVAAAVRAFGVRHLAITHGPESITWWSGDRSGELAVPPVPAVDTTGAGDAFHGALAVALARDPAVTALEQMLGFATTVAGIRVQHRGPRSWLAAL